MFTKNNYSVEDIETICSIECRYLVVGKETAPTTGTEHLQGYVVFDNARALKAVAKLLLQSHVEVARGNHEQASNYCKKEGDFVEHGVLPSQGHRKDLLDVANSIIAKRSINELALESPDIYIKYHKGMLALRSQVLSTQTDRPTLDNLWIWGASGAGKSRSVREDNPSLYLKGLNKWWDNYDGEECVLLDDFGPEHGKFLTGYLKQWSDHYAFSAEFKGGSFKIRPARIVVTSNYQLEDCFETAADIAALKRRFTQVNK